MPGGATAITTAPVDFNGDNRAVTFRVYRVGATWHARAQIAGVAVSDVVVVGQGPSMTAIGGATVNNDTKAGGLDQGRLRNVNRPCQLLRIPSVRPPAGAAESKIYIINLSGTAPTLVLGATATQSESDPPGGNAFDVLSRFTCDNLRPSIP